jgi:hypothetical protein
MIIAPHPARGSIMFSMSPGTSPNVSRPSSPGFPGSPTTSRSPYVRSPNISRPTTPRPRRRSSQQRVSVLAGRLSLLPVSEPVRPEAPQRLVRSGSARSFLSVAASVGPPTPDNERLEYISGRSMSEFVVERELGRGAYGLVKRAREMNEDGTMGVSAPSAPLSPRLHVPAPAPASNQADLQDTHSCRLLEAAPKARDDTDRDLRSERHLVDLVCASAASAMGSLAHAIRRRQEACRGRGRLD